MGGTLKDVMDELTPERRARIEARADEIYREYNASTDAAAPQSWSQELRPDADDDDSDEELTA